MDVFISPNGNIIVNAAKNLLKSMGSPVKRVNGILAAKLSNSTSPKVQALFNPRIQDGYVLKSGQINYTPAPHVQYTASDAEKLTYRGQPAI